MTKGKGNLSQRVAETLRDEIENHYTVEGELRREVALNIKNMVEIALDENKSVTHDYLGKFGSATVLLKKAPEGTGIIAGGPARIACELAGVKNIRTKSLGSNNKTNVALAAVEGLSKLKSPEDVARNRGKSVDDIRA